MSFNKYYENNKQKMNNEICIFYTMKFVCRGIACAYLSSGILPLRGTVLVINEIHPSVGLHAALPARRQRAERVLRCARRRARARPRARARRDRRRRRARRHRVRSGRAARAYEHTNVRLHRNIYCTFALSFRQ